MKKKLIGFEDDLMNDIEAYSNNNGLSFTEGVRVLTGIGLAVEGHSDTPKEEQGDSVDFPSLVALVDELSKEVKKLAKDMSWWNADENESKVGNLNIKIEDLEKKINVLTSVSKLFKGHLKDREIHLQD